jgi:hypothetical protein
MALKPNIGKPTSTDYTSPGVRRQPPVTFNPPQPVKTKTSK